jgi:hypothetical protein
VHEPLDLPRNGQLEQAHGNATFVTSRSSRSDSLGSMPRGEVEYRPRHRPVTRGLRRPLRKSWFRWVT